MKSHDELLEAAIAAHRDYLKTLEDARSKREKAFRDAIRGPVKGREIASKTGLSESQVSRISKGQR